MRHSFHTRWKCFHSFDDLTVMHGYSKTYEQEHSLAVSKQLRALPAYMTILQPPGSDGDYYLAFFFVNDSEQ